MNTSTSWEAMMQAEDLSAPAMKYALKMEDAADALSMSLDSFQRHVRPDIRMVRCKRLVRVPVAELLAWLEKNAECVGREW